MADWAELPGDMLTLITSFLPIADTHRFSAVCQNWCSVTKEKKHRPVPQLPWLVLTDDECTGKRRIYNMSENKHYHFDIPELRGAFIIGSSFGWLFAIGPRLDAYLVNPFSGAKFALPSLPIYEEDLRPEKLVDHVKRCEYSCWPLNKCYEAVQHLVVMKAVLSCDPNRCTDFMVFILLSGKYRLAFYKPGDTTWTLFDSGDYSVFDLVCFKGQFYAILEDNVICTVDISPEPKISRCAPLYPYDDDSKLYFVVDYNGESLLLVSQLLDWDKNDKNHRITTEFHVFKVDLERYNTCELKDINGHALFLGNNVSIVVRASDFNGCMANSLYFCDIIYGFPDKKYGYDDMGVYNLEDKSIGHFIRGRFTTLPNHALFGWFLTRCEMVTMWEGQSVLREERVWAWNEKIV